MIRNAIDHGLESPEGRLAAGKPLEGTVRLHALHRSGRIVIEVADDGAGINRARVRDKAVKNGLIAADAVLTDEETDNLIFLPGFSTADAVSELSGRGVGMDVVRRSVQALGGRIVIASTSRAGLHLHAQPAAHAGGAGRHGGDRCRPDHDHPARRDPGDPAAARG